MFNPTAASLVIAPPMISIEALATLRDLISTLHPTASCDMDSLNQSPKERANEAISPDAQQQAVQLTAGHNTASDGAGQQTKRTGPRAGRTARKRRLPKRRKASKRRR